MIRNIKIYSLFEGFLETLNIDKLNIYERKLINLIKNDFDNIVSVGTFNGQRAKLLSSLIEKNGKGIDGNILIKEKSSSESNFPLKQLISMQVHKFRGFSKQEEFLFDKKYTLIYGPNGSGKSSFCDALEYGLLGYINEANAKRIDIEKYIRNANIKASDKPIVKGLDHSGKIVDVNQMPEVYNFCFIEKNRISDFSRISANTPAGQKGLLSTLFGLEDFNKFAMHFTTNFAEYIDIKGKKKAELEVKKKEILESEIKVKTARENLANLEEEKTVFVLKSELGKTFEEIETFLHGSKDKKLEVGVLKAENQEKSKSEGRIKAIEQELSKPTSDKYYVKKPADIDQTVVKFEVTIKRFKEKEAEYSKKKDAVTYKNLYSAITELEQQSKEKCPACQTPIDKTVVNPFIYAKAEIKKLGEIVKLELELEDLWNSIALQTTAIGKEIDKLGVIAVKLGCSLDVTVPEEVSRKSKNEALIAIETFIRAIRDNSVNFDKLYTKSEKENQKLLEATACREKLASEKTGLVVMSDTIKGINTRVSLFLETIARDSAIVAKFEETNKELIRQVASEKEQVIENEKYLEAYTSIIGKLKIYNESLPLKMVENLNDLTKEFYNVINKNDKKYELLDCVELPVSAEGNIRIRFKEDGEAEHDALHILSEGHIRCLGLAILLAKVVVDGKGIIIFDDVVNAIDDEHREGIRELLFKDDRIKDKQIILTSHAEEFIKDLDNQFKISEYQELVKRITFLRPHDARSILVDMGETTFNYLMKAESCLNRENKRDSLMNCRRALENITNCLWGRIGKTYKTELTVKLRLPKASPDLMSVAQALRKFMESNQYFSKEINGQIVDDFKFLEGLESANKSIWNYLNKGTHEESDSKEFDKAIVEKILIFLKRLNDNVKQNKGTVSAQC